jgi:hypothetical protein
MKLSKITGMYGDVRTFRPTTRLVDSDVDLGIEIELEGFHKYGNCQLQHPFWHVVDDGSLRNSGREFILTYRAHGGNYTPVRGLDFVTALDDWKKWLAVYIEKYAAPQTTKRTSIHVHVDVREMDVDQISRLILLYATFEPTLFALMNNGREEEIYCMPFSKNWGGKVRASGIINNSNSGSQVHAALHNAQKYESMNIHSIVQRGSIEFRIHHGTTDIEEMIRWVNILLCLRRAAMDENIQLMDYSTQASSIGLINFVGTVFKEYTPLVAEYLDEPLLLSGVRQAQDITQLFHIEKNHRSFESMKAGKKAGEESILHQWATENSRKVYID